MTQVPSQAYVGYVVDKVTLEQVYLLVLQLSCRHHSTTSPYSFIHLPLTL
jgi:hypothetical protein